MKLGSVSSTDDPEGEITYLSEVIPRREEIETVIKKFTGELQQIPPIYSAIKVGGQRAYKLARKGKEVVMEPRNVTINKLEVIDYTYPYLKLIADVTSGTYIRSLVRDIGKNLGTGAYTVSLRRTRIDSFSVEQGIDPKSLSVDTIEQLITS
jgi:tRNA pseudouridine55 synthase